MAEQPTGAETPNDANVDSDANNEDKGNDNAANNKGDRANEGDRANGGDPVGDDVNKTAAQDVEKEDDDDDDDDDGDDEKDDSAEDGSDGQKCSVSLEFRRCRLSELREFEASRRSKNKQDLDSSSLYWKSFRRLLQDAMEETERARSIVAARAHIDREYARSLEAIGSGDLDDDSRPIAAGGKKKAASRQNADQHRKSVSVLRTGKEGLLESRPESALGMLSSVVRTHVDHAVRYRENASVITKEILPILSGLCESLVKEVGKIEIYGNALLLELEASEMKVKEAWGRYEAAADKILAGEGGGGGSSDVKDDGDAIVQDSSCVWLVDMKYVVSVILGRKVWKKANDGLGKLFGRMKELEFDRRKRLQQVMVLFLRRQEQLWISLPAILGPCVKQLGERSTERTMVDEDIGSAIRQEAQNIKMNESAAGAIDDSNGSGGGHGEASAGAITGGRPAALKDLDSPLTSKLVGRIKVIERKKEGFMGGWSPVLALITADSFLHLFSIPSTAGVNAGSAAEVAFGVLIPEVDVPEPDDLEKLSKKGKLAKDAGSVKRKWHKLLAPSDSFVLPNSTVQFLPKAGDNAFELTETVLNTGASSMFSKTSKRKVILRAVNQEEAVDWIVSMKKQK